MSKTEHEDDAARFFDSLNVTPHEVPLTLLDWLLTPFAKMLSSYCECVCLLAPRDVLTAATDFKTAFEINIYVFSSSTFLIAAMLRLTTLSISD